MPSLQIKSWETSLELKEKEKKKKKREEVLIFENNIITYGINIYSALWRIKVFVIIQLTLI